MSKVKLLLGFLSSDLDDFFTHDKALADYDVKSVSLKDPDEFLKNTGWANALFVQWDGRGQLGHQLIMALNSGQNGRGPSLANPELGRPPLNLYAVTTSKIKIETLASKPSRQLNISEWFDLPVQKDAFLKELSLMAPDVFDDFSQDINNSELPFLKDLPLESLAGKHLVNQVIAAWDTRVERAKTVTKIKDEILRSHVTFFHNDQARTNDINQFLTEIRFKYHDEFSDISSCMRWIRGHGTDCLVVWYDANSRESETLLRMYLENRNFKRIPMVVLYPSEAALEAFKTNCQDLYVDKFILFDRHREKFKNALIDALTNTSAESSTRKLLDELRATSQDIPPSDAKSFSVGEVELACDKIASEPGRTYWADVERLLGYARVRETNKFVTAFADFDGKYKTFDALIVKTIARAAVSKPESAQTALQLVESLPKRADLNFDRLVRASIVLSRAGAVDALRMLLVLWWQSKNKFPISHEFYWSGSRWAQMSGFLALERALLAAALKVEPLRADYVESYANHLTAAGQFGPAATLGEYLSQSEYFPPKKAQLILFHNYALGKNKKAALDTIEQMISRWPKDKNLVALKSKLLAV